MCEHKTRSFSSCDNRLPKAELNNWISIKLSLKTNKIKLKKKSSLKLIKLSCVHAIQIKPRKWKAGPGPIKQVDDILSNV